MINNLKKVISTAAAVTIVASSASAFAISFPDVDESAAYAGSVQTLSNLGIVQGDENGLFNPDKSVTRAEFTTMVVGALDEASTAQATTVSKFTDAANTTVHWAAGYIATGVSEGWINGYDDTTFGPDDPVTYVQAVKMLVSAIGYETYAQRNGGWPSGYLGFGNTLGIIKGVSVESNDTELTRAQCAVLVANALKAPVVEYGDIQMGGLLGNIPLDSLQQMNGTGEGWQTLLTRKHDAYAVKGRVTATSKTLDSLDPDQVQFKVEVAENFDGDEYTGGDDTITVTANVGDTKAADMQFQYADAILQENEDTGDYTIISIAPYGVNSEVSFDSGLYDDFVDGGSGRDALAVYRTETSSSTTNYKLADDATVYINGVEMTGSVKDVLDAYLKDNTNAVGNVTLIDQTESGSTSTDGYYDYIVFDYYIDAIVDSVSTSSTEARIYFKAGDTAARRSRLTWDTEDDQYSVVITKDGAAIEYTDLVEYDVLSIAYDVERGFEDSMFYDVQVAQNSVTGSISSKNTEDQTLTVDGTEYDVAAYYLDGFNDTFEFNTEYTLYLDAFGRIAYYEEGAASRNIGVVVAMYDAAGSSQPTVRMLLADGSEVAYEVRDNTEALNFYRIVMADDKAELPTDVSLNVGLSEIVSRGIQNMVVDYRLSSGKLRLNESLKPRNDDGSLTYNASRVSLDSYNLDENATSLLAVDAYINDTGSANVMSVSQLTDDAEYTAYVYDRSNSTMAYRFVLVTGGLSDINALTTMAVVSGSPRQVSQDGENYVQLPVYVAGSADPTTILVEDDNTGIAAEGDVIIYAPASDGTVDSITTVMSVGEYGGYDSFAKAALGQGSGAAASFKDMINDTVFAEDQSVIDASGYGEYTWWKSTSENRSGIYFGPVYRKSGNNLEVAVERSERTIDGESGVMSTDINSQDEIQSFAVGGDVETYVVDFSARAGQNQRVYKGDVSSMATSIYGNSLINTIDEDQNDASYIRWTGDTDDDAVLTGDTMYYKPNFALVKVVEGDATEVVYFLAD